MAHSTAKRIVRPVSAPRRSIAASGPGCGGTRPCEAESPATSGSASVSSGRPDEAARPTTIGKSSTRPTLKKTGRPSTNPSAATAHGSARVPDCGDDASRHHLRRAGFGQQLPEDAAKPDDDRDESERRADAVLKRADRGGRRHAGADGQRERDDA